MTPPGSSRWHQAPSICALLALMDSAARRALGDAICDDRVALFVWDAAAREFLDASLDKEGPAVCNDSIRAWLRDNPDQLAALHQGDAVFRTACEPRRSGCLILPLGAKSALEGVLCVACDRPLEEQPLADLRRWCHFGAVVLASLREGEQLRVELCGALHDLSTPLVAARGYTNMILQAQAGAITDTQREYLLTVKDNVERMVRMVAELRRAGVEA